MQVDPSVKLKLNIGRAIERIAEVNGAPPDVLFSQEEVDAKQQAESAGNAVVRRSMRHQISRKLPSSSPKRRNFHKASRHPATPNPE